MGSGSYSSEAYSEASRSRGYSHKSTRELFKNTLKADVSNLASSFNTGARVNNTNVKPEMLCAGVRESRDSAEHPHTTPIIIALDVTGSMYDTPEHMIKEQFPKLMEKLEQLGVQDPQLLFMAIGDHECDSYPIQTGQFESDTNKILDSLQSFYLEGGGGPNYGSKFNIRNYIRNLCIIVYPNKIISLIMTERVLEKLKTNNVKELYESGKSLNELEKLVHTDKKDIKIYLIACGVKLRDGTKLPDNYETLTIEELEKSKSERTFNFKIFDVIDTEEKAYWLGFWFADGCVNSDMLNLELTLKADDVVHLHKFNRFIGSIHNDVKYHYKKEGDNIFDLYRWINQSKHMCNTLSSYGCTPKKSLTLKFPNEGIFKSKDLIRHFIRGYWDGDGCICCTEITKIVSAVGTLEFLTTLKSYLPVESGTITKKVDSKNTYTLQFSRKQALYVLHYLYDNSTIYLNRKFEKYKEYCRIYEGSYISSETNIGEGCDANTEINSEIKESESS